MACCIPLTIGSSGRYVEKFKSHCGSRLARQEDAADEAQDDDRERSDEPAISEVVITLVSARPMAEKLNTPSTV